MKITTIFLLISFLIITSCWFEWNKILISTHGFSIVYPSSFSAGKDTSNWIALLEKWTNAIIIVNKTLIIENKTDDEIIKFYSENSVIDLSWEFIIDWKKWAFVEFTNKYWNIWKYHKDIWLNDWINIYGISCTVKEEEKEKIKNVCNSIAKSLIIKNNK